MPGAAYDVTVIGAGVVGSAIARELARLPLRIALLDASDDVGDGTSKANTAILHTGFDAVPGTLESRLVRDGSRRLAAYAAENGIPVEPLGALLVAWDAEQHAALPGLAAKAERNGYHDARIIPAEEVRAREPHLGPGVLGALDVPGESVICPWTTTLAYATQAVRAGVDLHLNCPVRSATSGDPHLLTTGRGPLRTRHLVNAAGLHADEIDRLLGHADFTVTPRRGQLIVFDELARDLVRHILLPVPTALGKGVLVTPTVHVKVMLFPTAENLDDKTATGSTAEGIALLREKGPAHPARPPRRGGHRRVRGTAGRHRIRGLRDPRPPRAALRDGGRHPLDGTDGLDGDRVPRGRPPGRGRAARDRTPGPRTTAHAEPGRGVPPPLPRRGTDRGGPRVRPYRLPLRTRHPRGDPRRARLDGPARLARRPPTAHPRPGRPLPGLPLRGRGPRPVRPEGPPCL
ncbi:LOW QUALITY PROTEIN: oxidoreductase, partial [Streptomyces sp. C]